MTRQLNNDSHPLWVIKKEKMITSKFRNMKSIVLFLLLTIITLSVFLKKPLLSDKKIERGLAG